MCFCTSSSWLSEAENSNIELSSRYRVYSHEPYLKSIAKRRTFLTLFYHPSGTAECDLPTPERNQYPEDLVILIYLDIGNSLASVPPGQFSVKLEKMGIKAEILRW